MKVKPKQQKNQNQPFRNKHKYNVRHVSQIFQQLSKTSLLAVQYPIQTILLDLSRLYEVNQIEALFISFIIRQTKWQITSLVDKYAYNTKDIVGFYLADEIKYKSVTLYLILNFHHIKTYLNHSSGYYSQISNNICPQFQKCFELWVKNNNSIIKSINPKTLNHVYCQLSLRRSIIKDYNNLIDSIIQISPPYRDANYHHSQSYCPVKQQNDPHLISNNGQLDSQIGIERCQVFSSSKLNDLAYLGKIDSEIIGLQVFGNNQKSTLLNYNSYQKDFLGSSIYKAPIYSLLQEQKCSQINLGLQQGQSESNITPQEKNDEAPPTTIIDLSKIFSISQKQKSIYASSQIRF